MACQKCGSFFLPLQQFKKIRNKNTKDYVRFCPACKRLLHAESLYQGAFREYKN
jgi:predicted  nucleic acid-binding Zn-ribbon protein